MKRTSDKEKVSNWGHYVSMMPYAETADSTKDAIDCLNVDRTNVFGLCVHHTDGETAESARRTLSKKGLSTHFIIDKNGDITVELPLDNRAAACVGFNKWMWQVDVVGRLHINEPTKEQMLALGTLIERLSCGRIVTNIDSKFAAKCRKLNAEEVQKETNTYFSKLYEKLHIRAEKKGSWEGVLDKTPFIVTYHGEVRPTACCGKHLINALVAKLKGELKCT